MCSCIRVTAYPYYIPASVAYEFAHLNIRFVCTSFYCSIHSSLVCVCVCVYSRRSLYLILHSDIDVATTKSAYWERLGTNKQEKNHYTQCKCVKTKIQKLLYRFS